MAPIDYLAIEGGLQKQMRDYHLVALCDDGSVWRFGVGGSADWQRMPDVPLFDFPDTGLGKSNGTVAIQGSAGPSHLT